MKLKRHRSSVLMITVAFFFFSLHLFSTLFSLFSCYYFHLSSCYHFHCSMAFRPSPLQRFYHSRLNFARELSSVAVFVHFLIPIFVVVVAEAFGYSLYRLFLGRVLVRVGVEVRVTCVLWYVTICLCMRIYTCLHLSLLLSHLLVWVSVSPLFVDFYFESVYCWDLASVEFFVFFFETRTTH